MSYTHYWNPANIDDVSDENKQAAFAACKDIVDHGHDVISYEEEDRTPALVDFDDGGPSEEWQSGLARNSTGIDINEPDLNEQNKKP